MTGGGTLLTFGTQGAAPEPARLSGSPIQSNVLTGTVTGARGTGVFSTETAKTGTGLA